MTTEARKNIMLGTAGHVDHGKTALVKLLTGCDTDRLAEEKARGLTIELGFAPCAMRDQRIAGIVDVPGHVDFIRNMVAGAHGVDVVILVVAADDGVMPQTREHLDILTLMGARHGLVALTKVDLVDDELRKLVAEDVRGFLAGTFLAGAPICPISNVTGEGFDGFFAALNEAVESCQQHETFGLFRLWAERSFSIRGFGTVVSGIPTSGQVKVGDRLRILPEGLTARVRNLEVYGQPAELGRAGECIALNLTDVEAAALHRGQVLCEGDAYEPVTIAEAELTLLPSLPTALKDYAEAHLHVGTAEGMVHVALLEDRQLAPGARGLAQLRLREPLALAPGERFVIRASMAGLAGGRVTTVGGGRVLGTGNVKIRRQRPWTIAALNARAAALDSPAHWCELCLQEAAEPLTAAELARRARMRLPHVEELLPALQADGRAIPAAGGFVHPAAVEQAARQTAEALAAFHQANPLRAGMDEAELRHQVQAHWAVFDLAAARLAEAGHLERQGAVLALAGQGARLSADDRAVAGRIEQALREARLEPPGLGELASAIGCPEQKARQLLRLLIDQGQAVELDERITMHAEAVAAAAAVVVELFRKAGGFSTVEFRDALGVSRKFAVPLLDYFDTVHLTVRSGSRRTPGTEARRRLADDQA